MSPFTILGITFMNVLSVVLSLATSDMIMMWFYMEIGMMSFVLMLMNNLSKKSASLSLKYFVFQALCSVFMLFALTMKFSCLILMTLLLMKMGLAPFHLWFMSISKHVSSSMFMWMGIIQKLVPIFILSSVFKMNLFLMLMMVMSMLISSLNILLQIKLMGVLAGSSVFSSNWLVLSCGADLGMTMKFLMIYSLLLFVVLTLHEGGFMSWVSTYCHNISPYMKGELFIMLLMLGGLPPSPLFFMKLEVLFSLMNLNLLLLSSLLLLCSSISFYGYMNINMTKLSLDSRITLLNKTGWKLNTIMCLFMLSFLLMV